MKKKPMLKRMPKMTPGYSIEGVGPGSPMSGGTRENIRKPVAKKRKK